MTMTADTATADAVGCSAALRELAVVHLSACDDYGGSARAAYRLHGGLRQRGWSSRMLVARKVTNDLDVGSIWPHAGWRTADAACRVVSDRFGLPDLYSPSSGRLRRHPWIQAAHIIQCYNTHGGFLPYAAIVALSRQRPVVWRLDDMWALTGHCAYSYECERWVTGCGACPHLGEPPALRLDTTRLLWRRKARTFQGARLTLVAPSTWMAGLIRRSPLLGHCEVHHIPYGVDLALFRPLSRAEARGRLGWPTGGSVVLYVAQSVQERRKGGDLLRAALERIRPTKGAPPWRLVIIGGDARGWPPRVGAVEVTTVGYLGDANHMALAYAAADLTILPSRADNLPNVLIESAACGTPAVTFDVGGCGEVVRHLETGYVAVPESVEDLGRGLQRLLEDGALRLELGRRARTVAEAEYGLDLEVDRYVRLYQEVAAGRTRQAATSVHDGRPQG